MFLRFHVAFNSRFSQACSTFRNTGTSQNILKHPKKPRTPRKSATFKKSLKIIMTINKNERGREEI